MAALDPVDVGRANSMALLEADGSFPDIDNPEFIRRLAYYITNAKGGYFLRKFDLKNQSCYVSSVTYILICMLSHLGKEEMAQQIKKILNFRNFQSSILTNIIGRNAADVSSIRISSIGQLDDAFENGIAFLGLVTMGEDGIHRRGLIHHYFLLKRHLGEPSGGERSWRRRGGVGGGSTYSILSSYGSSNVAMRQYQTRLDPALFDEFLKDLAEPDVLTDPKSYEELVGFEKTPEAMERITAFMRTHFLDPRYKTIQMKNKDDLEDVYGEDYKPSELEARKNEDADIKREIGYFLKGPCYLMLFPQMFDLFQSEIDAVELKEASQLYQDGKISYDEFWGIYSRATESTANVLAKLEATKDKLARPLEDAPKTPSEEVTVNALARLNEQIAYLSPFPAPSDPLEGLTAGITELTVSPKKPLPVKAPATPESSRAELPRTPLGTVITPPEDLPMSPLMKATLNESKEEKEAKGAKELDKVEQDEILNQLGFPTSNLGEDLGAESKGGRKTRKNKRTKRIKKVKRKSRKVNGFIIS